MPTETGMFRFEAVSCESPMIGTGAGSVTCGTGRLICGTRMPDKSVNTRLTPVMKTVDVPVGLTITVSTTLNGATVGQSGWSTGCAMTDDGLALTEMAGGPSGGGGG